MNGEFYVVGQRVNEEDLFCFVVGAFLDQKVEPNQPVTGFVWKPAPEDGDWSGFCVDHDVAEVISSKVPNSKVFTLSEAKQRVR